MEDLFEKLEDLKPTNTPAAKKKEEKDDKKSDKKEVGFEKMINSRYGNRTIYSLKEVLKPDVYPFNSYSLNYASGIGGIAKGYIHEIYGQTGSGKTTITLGIIANAQKQGDKCLYVDAENRFDAERGQQIGVNIQDLYISQNNMCETVFDMIADALESGEVQLVVLDSLATLITENEYESDMEKAEVGNKAKLIGKGLRKVVNTINNAKSKGMKVPTLILTNQVRNKTAGYGNSEVVPGGEAPKFFSSQRIQLVAKHFFDEADKEISLNAFGEDDSPVGVRVFHKHKKNSFAMPQKTGAYNIFWDDRVIDNKEELISLGLESGVIIRLNLRTYEFDGQKFTSRDIMLNHFRNNDESLNKLKQQLGL